MSSERIYLTPEEQHFLMEMLEIKDVTQAAERFATIMTEERADPTQMKKYIQKMLSHLKQ
jgi:hypothetical protein